MAVPRYAAKADSNAAELVSFARTMGCYVAYIREPVDVLVGVAGKWFPVEIKPPEKRGKANEFTRQQLDFFRDIGPHGLPHWVWYDINDIRASLSEAGGGR
jgi:hypothetical protein